MTARIHVGDALAPGLILTLPPGASRHVQVLRLQPGGVVHLFDGRGGQWLAEIVAMGRKDVQVRVGRHEDIERELPCAVMLALGMPANERMDTLIEKATELGVAAIQPLVCERSVLRVAGERAERKAAHWQAIAAAACEQSGRNRVPSIATPCALGDWLASLPAVAQGEQRLLLSAPGLDPATAADAPGGAPTGAVPAVVPWGQLPGLATATTCRVLSGPEGGLSAGEQAAAVRAGFAAVSLGPRVLRADTAPLAVLAAIGLGRP